MGLGYRLYLTVNIAPPTNSDESTMGLAAMHIAEGRELPVFFYGQHYMGTIDAYLAAPLFVAFGPSIVALRLPMLAVYAAFFVTMYLLTARLYSKPYAVFVSALLAIGSHPVVRGEVFAGGGYPEIKAIGAGLLLLAVWLGNTTTPAGRRLAGYGAWGLLAGLAVWSDWLIGPYVGAAAAVLVYTCRRELLGRAGGLLVAGVCVGALPWILHHVHSGYGESAVAEILHLSRNGTASIGAKLYGGILLGVPMGTGLCEGGTCEGWPLALGAAYPLLLIVAATTAVVGFRRAAARPEQVRHAGRLALVLAAAVSLLAYTASEPAGLTPTTSVRYLTPLLISLPAVWWPLWRAAARLRSRFLPVTAAAVLGVHVLAMVYATAEFVGDVPASRTAARDEHALLARLDELGVTRAYSEYWTCNRITFASRERVVCAVLSDDLRPGHDRYLPYRDLVAAAPDPAYVLPIGSTVERAFTERLRAAGGSAVVDEVAGYRIYRPSVRLHTFFTTG